MLEQTKDLTLIIDGYLQDDREFFPFPQGAPSIACAIAAECFWMGGDFGLARFAGGTSERVGLTDAPPVTCLAHGAGGRLWIGTTDGLFCLARGAKTLARVQEGSVTALIASDSDGVWAATADGIRAVGAQTGHSLPVPAGNVQRLAIAEQGQLWAVASGKLFVHQPGGWEERVPPGKPGGSVDVLDCAAGGPGCLWVVTTNGLFRFDGMEHWRKSTGEDGFPLEQPTAVAVGADGTVAAGSPCGLAILRDGRWRYYAGRRWLSDDAVTDLLVGPAGEVWAVTPGGVSRLFQRPMRLEAKAAHCEAITAARHTRHGFVTTCILDPPGQLSAFTHEASDNDGLWTALYVAAEAFRYGATGSTEARQLARQSLDALIDLERRTPISGFPARAIARKDERVHLSRGEWHDCEDGIWQWKGDTSSDELDGHYFAFSVYFDVVADDDEKALIAGVVKRITDHLIENDYLLIDLDGEHTRWGVHAPRLLHTEAWTRACGLNAMEMLSHLKVAHHVTGEARYEEAYLALITEHRYALDTIRLKITEPGHVNHSDDELAFISYYPLLRHETNPHLRATYLASLAHSWENERPERSPFANFVYGAITGLPCDAEAAVSTLQEIPLDLIHWTVANSHRPDVERQAAAGRFGEGQSRSVLPAGERPMIKWNGNPYRLDGGNGGRTEEDGTFFLLPYWMGRYFGLIQERETLKEGTLL